MEFVSIFLTKKQLNDFIQEKTITVKQNGDIDLLIEFKDKKIKSKLLRNLKNNKGTRINLNMIKNYKVSNEENFEGGKINIGKTLNKLGKDAKSGVFEVNRALKSNPIAAAMVKEGAAQIANVGLTALGTASGNPIAGKIAGSMASQGVKAGLSAEGYGFNPIYKTATTSLGGQNQISSFSSPKIVGGLIDLYENESMQGGSMVKLNTNYRQIGKRITGGSFRGGSFKSPK